MTQKNKDICNNICSALIRDWYIISKDMFGSEMRIEYIPHIYTMMLFSRIKKRLENEVEIMLVTWSNLHTFLVVNGHIFDLYTHQGIKVHGRETIDKYFGYISTLKPDRNFYLEVGDKESLFGYQIFKSTDGSKQSKSLEYIYAQSEILDLIDKLKPLIPEPTKMPIYMFNKDMTLIDKVDKDSLRVDTIKHVKETSSDHYFMHV